jgi:hypothetical protein
MAAVNDPKNIKSIVDAGIKNGGFTWNLKDGSQPTTGYAVAVQGESKFMPLTDPGNGNEIQNIRLGMKQYLTENFKMFSSNPALHLGGWWDQANHEFVLDPVEVVQDRDAATKMGRDRNQQSIWDFGAGQEIDTGGTGDRPGADAGPDKAGADDTHGPESDRGPPADRAKQPASVGKAARRRNGSGDRGMDRRLPGSVSRDFAKCVPVDFPVAASGGHGSPATHSPTHLSKANPNHDQRGRFTTADQGTGSSGSGKGAFSDGKPHTSLTEAVGIARDAQKTQRDLGMQPTGKIITQTPANTPGGPIWDAPGGHRVHEDTPHAHQFIDARHKVVAHVLPSGTVTHQNYLLGAAANASRRGKDGAGIARVEHSENGGYAVTCPTCKIRTPASSTQAHYTYAGATALATAHNDEHHDNFENPGAPAGPRPLYDIADEISRDWRKQGKGISYAAKPYLDAMGSLRSLDDKYGEDDARGIVHYFLSNASQWKGDTAKRVKAELRGMLKAPRSSARQAWASGKDKSDLEHPLTHMAKPRQGNLGRCYELAGRECVNLEGRITGTNKDDGRLLVHGTIQGGGAPPLAHAWVQWPDGTVYEPATDSFYTHKTFMANFHPTPLVTYSQSDAAKEMVTSGHYGPWDPKASIPEFPGQRRPDGSVVGADNQDFVMGHHSPMPSAAEIRAIAASGGRNDSMDGNWSGDPDHYNTTPPNPWLAWSAPPRMTPADLAAHPTGTPTGGKYTPIPDEVKTYLRRSAFPGTSEVGHGSRYHNNPDPGRFFPAPAEHTSLQSGENWAVRKLRAIRPGYPTDPDPRTPWFQHLLHDEDDDDFDEFDDDLDDGGESDTDDMSVGPTGLGYD